MVVNTNWGVSKTPSPSKPPLCGEIVLLNKLESGDEVGEDGERVDDEDDDGENGDSFCF